MSSWVGSWWSCCHRGTWPGLGVCSGYGRMFHLLVGGVGGVEVGGLVWEVGGLWSEGDVGSELVLSGSVVGVGGPRLVWAIWVGSARRAVLYASCWLALSVS